jgi:hypothetical protein
VRQCSSCRGAGTIRRLCQQNGAFAPCPAIRSEPAACGRHRSTAFRRAGHGAASPHRKQGDARRAAGRGFPPGGAQPHHYDGAPYKRGPNAAASRQGCGVIHTSISSTGRSWSRSTLAQVKNAMSPSLSRVKPHENHPTPFLTGGGQHAPQFGHSEWAAATMISETPLAMIVRALSTVSRPGRR